MTILIDNESTRNIRSPLDIEKFSQRFKTENGYFSFPDPNLETIDKNLYYLLRNSREIAFENKYKYKPDYLSYDEYGTTMLCKLLMYVNGIFSAEDFDLQTVIIPTIQSITYILRDSYPNVKPDDLQEISW